MQLEQAAAHIGKKTSWKFTIGSLFLILRKIKEIALFQYQCKTDYFGTNFKKVIVKPEKNYSSCFFFLGYVWVFCGEVCCFDFLSISTLTCVL